jgi:hypothetical protein
VLEAAAWHLAIVADCKRCRARGVFHAAGLWWLFQRRCWHKIFYAVAGRLKCRACGDRARPTASRDAVPTVHLELPGELEWKRAVSRFRS